MIRNRMGDIIQKHLWADLANVPATPGVYAWYYVPDISDFDLDGAVAAVSADPGSAQARAAIRSLLDDRVFRYFREDPYKATVEGPLKPTFSGLLAHEFDVSGGLVDRIADDPGRLGSIRDALRASAPLFASPLYIGMATVLRTRLGRHKDLIERFRTAQPRDGQTSRTSDAGFAWQVAKRRIPPERLFVCTCQLPADAGTAVDVENILNRIYYPILGRN